MAPNVETAAPAKAGDPCTNINKNPSPWVSALGAAILSGGLMSLCFRPFNWHFLAWFALVPWLIVLPKINPRQSWFIGSLLGLVFYRVGLHWLFGVHGPLAGISICLLAVWMGFSFRVINLLIRRFGRGALLWAAPLAFTGHEIVRSEGPRALRFAYLALGYSQADNNWVSQIASMGGVYFLTFVLVAFNAALAYALVVCRRSAMVPLAAVAIITLFMGLASQPPKASRAATIPVACIQAEETDFRRYVELAEEALAAAPKPEFIVLPEHTIGGFADLQHPFVDKLRSLAKRHAATICVGAHTRAQPGSACDYDNVGLLIGPDGATLGSQSKSVPIPFFDDGNRATSQTAFTTPHGQVGIYVCYDGSFTDVPRGVVGAGAELLLVPVMNPAGWPEQQRWQQLDIAKFRSIELRRWAIRAASSGVSAIVSPTGEITALRSQAEGAGVLLGDVCCSDERTVFVQGGHLFAPLVGHGFLLLVILLTAARWLRRPHIHGYSGPSHAI